MKNEEVKIGMKVVPHDKTVEGWFNLSESHQWEIAGENGPPFLYVTEWEDEEKCWCLSIQNTPNTHNSDFFNASDFELYLGLTEKDWIDFVVEPSALELSQMNASAEELRLQFEGE